VAQHDLQRAAKAPRWAGLPTVLLEVVRETMQPAPVRRRLMTLASLRRRGARSRAIY